MRQSMKSLLKLCVMITLLAGAAFSQCQGGIIIPNPFGPIPNKLCAPGPGGGGGGAYTQGSVSYTGTFYVPVFGALAGNATEANVQTKAPITGTFANMVVSLGTAPGVGNGLTITFRDAAADTALTCATGNT